MMVLTDDNFEAIVDNGGAVLVDFWAPWCAPCHQFKPVFEQSAEENPDLVFGRVNAEHCRGIVADLRVTEVPTLMAFRDRLLVFRQSGVLPAVGLTRLAMGLRDLDVNASRRAIAERDAAIAKLSAPAKPYPSAN